MFMRDRWKIRGGGEVFGEKFVCWAWETVEGGVAREGPWGMIDLQF